MKKGPPLSVPTANGTALGLLVQYKQMLAGEKEAAHERVVDQRFITASMALMKFLEEKEVLPWLLKPCRCLDCLESTLKPPLIEMINSEVSFRHLMKRIEEERCCHRGPFA